MVQQLLLPERSKKKPYVRPGVEVFRRPLPKPQHALSKWLEQIRNLLQGRQWEPKATAELAFAIIAFGRMRAYGKEYVIIEIPEVAYHFREPSRHVRESLRLLQNAGVAETTPSRDHWKLAV